MLVERIIKEHLLRNTTREEERKKGKTKDGVVCAKATGGDSAEVYEGKNDKAESKAPDLRYWLMVSGMLVKDPSNSSRAH